MKFLKLCVYLLCFIVVCTAYAEVKECFKHECIYDPAGQLKKIFSSPYQPRRSDFISGEKNASAPNSGYYPIYEYFLIVENTKHHKKAYAHIRGNIYCKKGNECKPYKKKKHWYVPKIDLSVLGTKGHDKYIELGIRNDNLFRAKDGSSVVVFPILNGK